MNELTIQHSPPSSPPPLTHAERTLHGDRNWMLLIYYLICGQFSDHRTIIKHTEIIFIYSPHAAMEAAPQSRQSLT